MEVQEAIIRRRSIRKYNDKPVSDETVAKIMDAAIWAPSGVNCQPWYFVVVKSESALKQMEAVMNEVSEAITPNLKKRFEKHPDVITETRNFVSSMGNAKACILAFYENDNYRNAANYLELSMGASMQNICLAAADLGLGTCCLTAPVEAGVGPRLQETFAKGHGSMVFMITLGYYDEEPKAPKRREGRWVIK